MKSKASPKRWRRESAEDVALDILRGYFGLNAAALAYLTQQSDQPTEVLVAARSIGLPILSQIDAASLGSLQLSCMVWPESGELTPKGLHTADDAAELLVLVNAINDDYYLKSDVMKELRTLKRLLQPGGDIHRVLLAHKELLPITFRNEWADRLREPDVEFPIW